MPGLVRSFIVRGFVEPQLPIPRITLCESGRAPSGAASRVAPLRRRPRVPHCGARPQTRGARQNGRGVRVRGLWPAGDVAMLLAAAPCLGGTGRGAAALPGGSGPGGSGRRRLPQLRPAGKPRSSPSLPGPGAAIARPGCLKRVTFETCRCSENGRTQG